jgi:Xaa-Pro aminopeptidase
MTMEPTGHGPAEGTRRGSRTVDEADRVAGLLQAQEQAAELFAAVEAGELVVPGITESEASDRITALAADRFGVTRHWHKRIVRSGPNTLTVFRQEPPDRVIEEDDITFCDFGPVFDAWEADFGRTYVLGGDPVKARLRDALPEVFDAGRAYFYAHHDLTGERLYQEMVRLAEAAGWAFGGEIAGHLVGEFPHDTIDGERIESYIAPGNDHPMRRTDRAGRTCHWIMEVHLVDREREIGGFYEELLDLGDR